MKIAFITTKPPSLTSGAEVRNFRLIESLVECDNVELVHILYAGININKSHIKIKSNKIIVSLFPLKNRRIFESIKSYISGKVPYLTHLSQHDYKNEIEQIASDTDLLVVSELDGYAFISKFASELHSKCKILLDFHNVDSIRFQSEVKSSGIAKKILAYPLISKVKEMEIHALNLVSGILVCSEIDREYFNKYINNKKIHTIPNGVITDKSRIKKSMRKSEILFMGLLSYAPNDAAIRYYLDNIHEQVRVKVPNLKCTIIGKDPNQWLVTRAENDPTINLVGYVEDVRSYIQNANVCICPLLSGSGTRLKVLEYMAAGKPVVTTTVGCEGINVKNNENIIIADLPSDFSNAVINIINNTFLANKIGVNAKKLMQKKYDWKRIGKQFITVIQTYENIDGH